MPKSTLTVDNKRAPYEDFLASQKRTMNSFTTSEMKVPHILSSLLLPAILIALWHLGVPLDIVGAAAALSLSISVVIRYLEGTVPPEPAELSLLRLNPWEEYSSHAGLASMDRAGRLLRDAK